MAESIVRLKVESSEYDSKLKRASEGLTRYIEGCRKAGGTLEVVEADTLKYVQALGQMETKSTTAKGRLNEMTKAFTDLSVQYNHLTSEEKSSQFGQAMSASLEQLKTRINNTKTELSNIGKEIGESSTNFAGLKVESASLKDVFASLGSQFGVNSELMGVVTTGTIGMTAAITAGIAAVTAATKAWVDYNLELEKRDTDASVITGTNGEEAKKIADAAKAMSDVYNVDVREALNGVNTLMQQFGVTSDDAIQLVRDGLQGMLEGDGPKLLQMIQQFAPAFRDAGISADQLVAIIHNSEGGIFTDANMNAIVMGIKNIRLMTNSTSEALAKIGVNGDMITQKLKNGTMTIFDAMKLILTALQKTNAGSREAGEVMLQVFGRQGTAAGTNLAKAINTLNLNLDETKNQTGGVGKNLAMLEQKNERLQQAFRKAFGTEGVEDFIAEIKGDLIDTLSDALENSDLLSDGIKAVAAAIEITVKAAVTFIQIIGGVYDVVNTLLSPITDLISGLGGVQEGFNKADSSPLVSAVVALFDPVGGLILKLQSLLGLIDKARQALHEGQNQKDFYKRVSEKYFGKLAKTGSNISPEQKQKLWNDSENEVIAENNNNQGRPRFYVTMPAEDRKRNQKRTRTKTYTSGTGGIGGSGKKKNKIGRKTTRTTRHTTITARPKTEEQLNNEAIKNYTEQYVKLQQERENALNSGDTQKAAQIEGHSWVLQIEIAALKQRNEQLKKWKDEANGNVDDIVDPNSLKGLNDQLAELKKNQDLSTTHEQWQKWQNDIDGVQKKIDDINGKSAKKDFSSLTSSNISGFISDLQQQLGQINIETIDYTKILDKEQAATEFQQVIQEALNSGMDPSQFGDIKGIWSKILNGENIDDDIQSFIGKLNEALANANLPTISLMPSENGDGSKVIEKQGKDAQVLGKHYKEAAQAIGQVGQAMNSLKDPTAKIVGTIAQAIADVALGAGSAIAHGGGKMGPWAWIAFAAAATATMISTISSIHSATGYARGGIVRAANGASLSDYGTIVPGNSMSGDLIPARINSGELILNRAQQGNLAAQLDSIAVDNVAGSSRPYVSGENIYVALNNFMMRRGLGELTAFKHR